MSAASYRKAMCAFAWTLVVLVAAGCSHSSSSNGPLRVQPPAGWEVKFDGKSGMYTVSQGPHELLMISKWPPPSPPDRIPQLITTMAESLIQESRKSSELKVANEKYAVEPIAGKQFNGSFVAFRVSENTNQIVLCMFMVSDGGPIWNGQFTGTDNGWTNALKVLKSLKRN